MAQQAPSRSKIPTTGPVIELTTVRGGVGGQAGARLVKVIERLQAAPVIGAIVCQDITTRYTQQIVNAAPTPGEGGRVRGMISALVSAGLEGGYLASARRLHTETVRWQPPLRHSPARVHDPQSECDGAGPDRTGRVGSAV
jgi:hypothetical protein